MLKVECIGCEDHGQSLFSLCYQNGALKIGCQNLFSKHFFQLPDLPSRSRAPLVPILKLCHPKIVQIFADWMVKSVTYVLTEALKLAMPFLKT